MEDIQKVRITPQKAKTMLEKNVHNRPLSPAFVLRLRADMEAGRWHEGTLELIRIAEDGTLLDGQHRLEALAGSNVESLNFWVAYGVQNSAQEFMDLGKSRSAADILRLRHPDIAHLPVVAGMCRWLAAMPELGIDNVVFASRVKASGITAHQIVNVFESDPKEIQKAAIEWHRFNGINQMIPPTIVGYVWYHIEKVDRGAAPAFFDAIKTTTFNHGPDPRLATFEASKRVYMNPDISNGSKEASAIYAALLTRGYNAWAEGRDIQIINWRSGGRILEPVKPIPRQHH